MLKYRCRTYEQGIKEQVIEIVINGSGIRDNAKGSKINKNTVISTLKKMHDTVIGLLINKVEFGLDIHAKSQL